VKYFRTKNFVNLTPLVTTRRKRIGESK